MPRTPIAKELLDKLQAAQKELSRLEAEHNKTVKTLMDQHIVEIRKLRSSLNKQTQPLREELSLAQQAYQPYCPHTYAQGADRCCPECGYYVDDEERG